MRDIAQQSIAQWWTVTFRHGNDLMHIETMARDEEHARKQAEDRAETAIAKGFVIVRAAAQ